MRIRDAEDRDLAGIAAIYNDAVLNTTAIWNDTVVDEANRRAWHADRMRLGYPVLVALDAADGVIGYASFGDWRAFDGYRHTVEHSVYVRGDQRGRGIGRVLMQALIGRPGQAAWAQAGSGSATAAAAAAAHSASTGRRDTVKRGMACLLVGSVCAASAWHLGWLARTGRGARIVGHQARSRHSLSIEAAFDPG